MSYAEDIKLFAGTIPGVKVKAATEESTKQSMILPLLRILGYDVFNPEELVPEYDCDLNKKKGAKVDYAILYHGKTAILIECKHWAQEPTRHGTQLASYFAGSDARFGILTNGVQYDFYTDTQKENIMDGRPFYSLHLEALSDEDVAVLGWFRKDAFDPVKLKAVAERRLEDQALRERIEGDFDSPSENYVRYLYKGLNKGNMTPKVIEQKRERVKSALSAFLADKIDKGLALAKESATEAENGQDGQAVNQGTGVVTTQKELLGFNIVRAIVADIIPAKRISYSDKLNYCRVIVDGKVTRTLLEMKFNAVSKLKIAFTLGELKGQVFQISTPEDIFSYSKEIRAVAQTLK